MNTTNETNEAIANRESEQTEQATYDADFYTKKAIKLFDELGVEGNYTREGIKANIEAWMTNKQPLFNLLRKHPNWNEEAKAVIIPSHKETRDGNNYERCKALSAIISSISISVIDDFLDRTCWTVYNILERITKTQFLDCDEDRINMYNEALQKFDPSIKLHAGQKTSRIANKIFKSLGADKLEDYNKLYARFADACNPLTVTRTSILSANWLDFMMMSHGNSWSSCHDITPNADYNGCYKAGCMSYGNDEISLIFYTIEDGHTEDFFAVPKITRQIFFWQNPVLVQERLYPQCNDSDDGKSTNSAIKQYRELVESIIATCENKPNLWEKTTVNIYKNDDCFMYEDWNHFRNWIVKFKDTDQPCSTLYVGAESYCLECGDMKTYSDGEGTLYCSDCECKSDTYRCDYCNWETEDEDDLHYCEDTGEDLCENCCTYCEYHERWESNRNNEFYEVENYGWVCDTAIDNGDFVYCDHCESYYYCYNTSANDVDNCEVWCDSCIAYENLKYCDGCQTYHSDPDTIYFTRTRMFHSTTYCADYADDHDMLVTCDNCGRVDLIDNMERINNGWYCEDCEEGASELVTANTEADKE